MTAEKLARKLYDETQNYSKEELDLLEGVIDFRKASADLIPLILSMIVPTNLEDDKERPAYGIVLKNGDNQLQIGYIPNKKAEWRNILLAVGKYHGIDFSDILNDEGNFRRTFDSDGNLLPECDDYDPRYVHCDKTTGQLLVDSEVTEEPSEVNSEVSEVVEDAEIVEEQ